MTFITNLTEEHREVEQSLKKLIESETVDMDQVNDLMRQLQMHMAVEEKYLYPPAEKELNKTEQVNLVQDGAKEHSEAKDYIIKLTNTDYVSQDSIQRDLEGLLDSLKHHHKDEEEDLFPKLKKEFSQKQMDNISLSVSAFKENSDAYVTQ